jgi:hypothetical protein
LEVTEWKENWNIIHGQVKPNRKTKHGRVCVVYENGSISDQFYKDNILHGPALTILPNGDYNIKQWEEGQRKS